MGLFISNVIEMSFELREVDEEGCSEWGHCKRFLNVVKAWVRLGRMG